MTEISYCSLKPTQEITQQHIDQAFEKAKIIAKKTGTKGKDVEKVAAKTIYFRMLEATGKLMDFRDVLLAYGIYLVDENIAAPLLSQMIEFSCVARMQDAVQLRDFRLQIKTSFEE